jgi:iron complex outermembrane receptor protein
MIRKLGFIKILLLVTGLLFFRPSFAQQGKNKSVLLTALLEKISNTHKVFFTYDANLLSDKYIQEKGFTNLSLSASISLLKKLTSFLVDDLGNNYYVVYPEKIITKNDINPKTKTNKYSNISLDTAFALNKKIVKGIVLSSDNIPLSGATLQEKGSLKGVTTNKDGTFEFEIVTNNLFTISFLGHNSKTTKLVPDTFNKIILLSGQELDEVQIVGSRNKNRVSDDTPVPIDIIYVDEMTSLGAQVSISQILNYMIPSFSSNSQTISDGTDHIDPVQLRGLGPDQMLVLINGKRRHTSSLINVNGTPGRGSVGTDLNSIPTASIKRIEILRDGAAAQYGSDAIAGVINIVLKNNFQELTVNINSGVHLSKNSNNHNGGIDGEKHQIDANYGIPLGNKGGFVNLTGSLVTRERTFRADINRGPIFNAYNGIEYQAHKEGFNLSNLRDNLDAIKFYGAQVPYFNNSLKYQIANATSIEDLSGYNKLTGMNSNAGILQNLPDFTEQELIEREQTRKDYNMSIGQSGIWQSQLMVNLEIPFNYKESKFYAFGGLSQRNGDASGFYRTPGHISGRGNTLANINGFLPNITSNIIDQSLGYGYKVYIDNWDLDLSHTWGKNTFEYNATNTTNFYLQASSPTEFYAGLNGFEQHTVNLDVSKFYKNFMNGFNIAFGTEYRLERFFIEKGEEASYAKYNMNGELETSSSVITPSFQVTDFFGNQAAPGAQVFAGFTPDNEINEKRNSFALYADLEANITTSSLISGALRFENFSDFGSTLNAKLALFTKINRTTNIRGALSTGFRAPSLHQQYYSKSNTLFDDNGVASEVGTFTNNSKVAELFGIPKLKEETSFNFSLGVITKIPNLTFTIDGFFIAIRDRITYTGNFESFISTDNLGDPITLSETQQAINTIFANLNIGKAAFFANAIDTNTSGLDIVATQKLAIGTKGSLLNNLAFTFSKTIKKGDTKGSELLTEAGLLNTYFNEDSRVFLELAVPRVKANLSHTYTFDNWSIFLRNSFFGSVYDTGALRKDSLDMNSSYLDSGGNIAHPEIGAKVITDFTLGYEFSKNLIMVIGANNIFDIYPDKLPNYLTSNQFIYSRRVSQFGNNGRYIFARLSFSLK